VATPDLSALLAAVSLEKPSARLAIRSGSRFVVVDTARACAIVAKDHYAAILVDGRELLSDDPLDVLEKKLDPAKFLRVHRSAIVNIDFIQELEREGDRKYLAVLSDPAKTRVAIARERLDEVKRRLGL
ncbi:MAG: LytTR family DNA-binding domain-containing protein, partial [Bdellovibrionota bacterium]